MMDVSLELELRARINELDVRVRRIETFLGASGFALFLIVLFLSWWLA